MNSHASTAEETEKLTTKLLDEKTELIEELRREAQKLSDKQFKSSNINKKLQSKNKVGCLHAGLCLLAWPYHRLSPVPC